MSTPITNEIAALEQWKALAKIENERARENWGRYVGTYQRPETFGDPKENAARELRDEHIAAWAADGISVAEISARTGLVRTSINRILRVRRLKADAREHEDMPKRK